MRRAAGLAALLLASPPAAAAPVGPAPRPVVAVADFQPTNTLATDANAISSFVRSALVATNVVDVLERKNMAAILAEQAFQQTGCTTSECAVRLGRILNVKNMIVGEYIMLGHTRYLALSWVDVETGTIERYARVKGFLPDDADEAADEAVRQLTGVDLRIHASPPPLPEPVAPVPSATGSVAAAPASATPVGESDAVRYARSLIRPAAQPAVAAVGSRRIAIGTVETAGGLTRADGDGLASHLRVELMLEHNVAVSPRAEVEEALAGQAATGASCASLECAVGLGKQLGVRYVVVSRFERIGGRYVVTARMVDVTRRQVIATGTARGANLETLEDGLGGIARILADKL